MSRIHYADRKIANISIKEMVEFGREREKIRLLKESGAPKPYTQDDVLKKSKFCNIFREDDTTSKWLFSKYNDYCSQDFDKLWLHIFLARFFNRIDVLDKLFPVVDAQVQLQSLVASGLPLLNPGAYQFFPTRVGGTWNCPDVRAIISDQLEPGYHRTLAVVKTFNNESLVEGTVKLNKAWGSHAKFWMQQCLLDLCHTTNGFIDKSSDCYRGRGGQQVYRALGVDMIALTDKVNKLWKDKKRPLHPFDAEQLFCEYRKYKQRLADGIPTNRRYNGEAA